MAEPYKLTDQDRRDIDAYGALSPDEKADLLKKNPDSAEEYEWLSKHVAVKQAQAATKKQAERIQRQRNEDLKAWYKRNSTGSISRDIMGTGAGLFAGVLETGSNVAGFVGAPIDDVSRYLQGEEMLGPKASAEKLTGSFQRLAKLPDYERAMTNPETGQMYAPARTAMHVGELFGESAIAAAATVGGIYRMGKWINTSVLRAIEEGEGATKIGKALVRATQGTSTKGQNILTRAARATTRYVSEGAKNVPTLVVDEVAPLTGLIGAGTLAKELGASGGQQLVSELLGATIGTAALYKTARTGKHAWEALNEFYHTVFNKKYTPTAIRYQLNSIGEKYGKDVQKGANLLYKQFLRQDQASIDEFIKRFEIFQDNIERVAPNHTREIHLAISQLSVAGHFRALEDSIQGLRISKFMAKFDFQKAKNDRQDTYQKVLDTLRKQLEDLPADVKAIESPVTDMLRNAEKWVSKETARLQTVRRIETQNAKNYIDDFKAKADPNYVPPTRTTAEPIETDVPSFFPEPLREVLKDVNIGGEQAESLLARVRTYIHRKMDDKTYGREARTLTDAHFEASRSQASAGFDELHPDMAIRDSYSYVDETTGEDVVVNINDLMGDLRAGLEPGVDIEIAKAASSKLFSAPTTVHVSQWLKRIRTDAVDKMDEAAIFRKVGDSQGIDESEIEQLIRNLDSEDYAASSEAHAVLKEFREDLIDAQTADGGYLFDLEGMEIGIKELATLRSKLLSDATRGFADTTGAGAAQAYAKATYADLIDDVLDSVSKGGGPGVDKLRVAQANWREHAETWKRYTGGHVRGKKGSGEKRVADTDIFDKFVISGSRSPQQARKDFDRMFGEDNTTARALLAEAYRRRISKLVGTNPSSEKLRKVLEDATSATSESPLAGFYREFEDHITFEGVDGINMALAKKMGIEAEVGLLRETQQRTGLLKAADQALQDQLGRLNVIFSGELQNVGSKITAILARKGESLSADNILANILPSQGGNPDNIGSLLASADEIGKKAEVKSILRSLIYKDVINKSKKVGKGVVFEGGEPAAGLPSFNSSVRRTETLEGDILQGYLDDNTSAMLQLYEPEELQRLRDISSILNAASFSPARLPISGIPGDISLEGLLSRGYAISRGVVSPRFIISELSLRVFRKTRFNMLKSAIEEPEIASLIHGMLTGKIKADWRFNRKFAATMVTVLVQGGLHQDAIDFHKDAEIMFNAGQKLIDDIPTKQIQKLVESTAIRPLGEAWDAMKGSSNPN